MRHDFVREFLAKHHGKNGKCALCHKKILRGQSTSDYQGKRVHSSCVRYERRNP